ncbi:hypothetical protein J7554_07220 [Wohlfahrtiimonas chitiniclastica]|uniref:hypothetical protein n=1 Tax=Wohlfahrtiimonas chitiniclastica TaxID=400946 RepID=UPI000B9860DE|nr:hypothetical protein [Wohlfahrtiimonas chitiniclastica]MBS7828916.1 hypothetical protein [Wohlfahrtiimonas chitiniclastica]OYQ79921.1 hypothetical protein B9T12_00470 [Wohlfahrtiimonas chitiniclastica]
MKKLSVLLLMAVGLVGCASVEKDTVVHDFTAYGKLNEPWRIVVKHDDQLEIEGVMVREGTLKVTRSAYAKGVEFSGDYDGQPLTLNIRSLKCKDSNGDETDFTATFYYGKRTYKGCAVAGAIEHADT